MSRIERLEIPRHVKFEVFKRAGGPDGLKCEKCGQCLRGKLFHYDHKLPEWLQQAPRAERTITGADVWLLGKKCCHDPKTAKEAGERAKGNRIIAKSAGIKKPGRKIEGRGFQTNRDGPYKQKMDRTVERRK